MSERTAETQGAGDTPTVASGKRGKLERTLGLKEALTIGLGTMVGAGIFVFPGLAVEEAGPAAALSFVLGAGIALLVALPTSELATAMPRSGGGYYFVSRAMGGAAGALVGLGQWLGLVFASAFYLAGFGHYLVDVLGQLGLPSGFPPPAAGFAMAAALTGVGIVGTRTSGRLQYGIVAVLVAILAAFLGWGILNATGIVGRPSEIGPFAPGGALPVFTTAALVFTSYLGFAQIANVAGEVKDPGRTLPRAMMGSVLIVGGLYVITILVSTAVLGTDAMAAAGETALTEVGQALLGAVGALVIGAAGLLATLSSANASILSSSRAVFALSRDGVLPDGASRVSRRFRTPHVAMLLAGVPIALLVLLGRIEVLAEVASILHLFMYGLMCLAAVVLRRRASLWYRPAFRTPGAPWLPALGALLCFGLLGFMSPRALAYSAVVLAAAGGWFLVYARGVDVMGVEELAPAPELAHTPLLLQVEVPDPPGTPDELIRALSPEPVVLLGWVQVPEQSDAEQVQDELGDDAHADLEALADDLGGLGMTVETDLVFTGDLVQTIDRTARERQTDAILSLRPVKVVGKILVALKDARQADEAAGYAARVAGATGAGVTVMHPPDEQDGGVDLEATLRYRFEEAGVEPERTTIEPSEGGEGTVAGRILEAAEGADLIIIGETRPEEAEETFGGVNETVMQEAGVPVLIVRVRGPREGSGDDGG